MLERKPLSRPMEPAHYFVADEQYLMSGANLPESGEKTRRRGDHPTISLDRLHHHRSHLIPSAGRISKLAVDQLKRDGRNGIGVASERGAEWIWIGKVDHRTQRPQASALRCTPHQGQRTHRPSVESTGKGNNARFADRSSGEFERHLCCLRA